MAAQTYPQQFVRFLNKLTVPAVFFVLCYITYGLSISNLGFYWDDWPTIWYYHRFGSSSFREVFLVDRPMLGWIFMMTTGLIKESITGWQILGIFSRWLSGITLWWLLSRLFPRSKSLAIWAGMLFLIYPGFTQQFISITYGHVFIYLTIGLLSLGTMIVAVKKPSRYWHLLIFSVILSVLHLFSVEYFFGLELMRPVILWYALSEKFNKLSTRIKWVIIYWIPFLIITILFLVWTIFFHKTPRGEIQLLNDLASSPFPTLLSLIFKILQDLFETTTTAWLNTVNIFTMMSINLNEIIISFVILIGIAGLVFMFLHHFSNARADQISNHDKKNPDGLSYIVLGIAALITAGWPVWVTDLELKLRFPMDRFTIPMMMGVCVLICGLISQIFRKEWKKNLTIALLVGFAAGFHYRNALAFQDEWLAFKDYFWQLTWRAPDLQPNTTILMPELPFDYFSDNSLTAPLNWIYDPHNTSDRMAYLLFDLESRFGKDIVSFSPDQPIDHPYRIASFSGSMANTILISHKPPRCLAVIGSEFETVMDSLRLTPEVIALSNPGLIGIASDKSVVIPEHIFGPQPDLGWCYWYQKASLARQTGDWKKFDKYGDEASVYFDTLVPEKAIELLPFIEGYALTGRLDESIQLSKKAIQLSEEVLPAVCASWNRIMENPPPEMEGQLMNGGLSDILGCD